MLKNHLNLQIVQALFSGPPCTSQAKGDMGMSAAAFMTNSVGKLLLPSQDGRITQVSWCNVMNEIQP